MTHQNDEMPEFITAYKKVRINFFHWFLGSAPPERKCAVYIRRDLAQKPSCFRSSPSYQAQAENDCHTCEHNKECLAQKPVVSEEDENEVYEIGKRDGYEEALQEIDCLTGGDGEYRWSDDPERSCPDSEAMKDKIVDRVYTLQSELQAFQEKYHPVIQAATQQPVSEKLRIAEEGLNSIAANSCCDGCQEAKKVALKYLAAMKGEK